MKYSLKRMLCILLAFILAHGPLFPVYANAAPLPSDLNVQREADTALQTNGEKALPDTAGLSNDPRETASLFGSDSAMLGDVNMDGAIDIRDFILTAQIAVGTISKDYANLGDMVAAANVNQDRLQSGAPLVGADDMYWLMQRIGGSISAFPDDISQTTGLTITLTPKLYKKTDSGPVPAASIGANEDFYVSFFYEGNDPTSSSTSFQSFSAVLSYTNNCGITPTESEFMTTTSPVYMMYVSSAAVHVAGVVEGAVPESGELFRIPFTAGSGGVSKAQFAELAASFHLVKSVTYTYSRDADGNPDVRSALFTDFMAGSGAYYTVELASQASSSSNYTVSFNAGSGTVSPSSISVVNGGTYGTLPVPSRSGYTFDGWFTQSSGGTQITASTAVNLSGDQTLYAHWTPEVSYSISFSENPVTVAQGETVVLTIYFSDSPQVNTTSVNINSSLASVVWGRIEWSADLYGTATTSLSITGIEPSRQTVKISLVDKDNNDLYTESFLLIVTEPVQTYTVSFQPGYSTSPPASLTVTNGQPYGDLPALTRSGYDFEGWFTAESGGTQVTASDTVNLSADQTLYAHWTPQISYSLSFSEESVTVAQGGTAELTIYFIDHSLIESIGISINRSIATSSWGQTQWASEENGIGIAFLTLTGVSPGQQTVTIALLDVDDNILYSDSFHLTVTAPSVRTYTVSFQPGYSTTSPASRTVTNGQAYGELPTLTRSGYIFQGWFTAESGGTQVKSSDTVNLSADQTLYAHWTPEPEPEQPSIADPVIQASNIIGGRKIVISCETTGTSIYYTTDGSQPNQRSSLYTGPFQLDRSCTVKAIAFSASGSAKSRVRSKTLDIEQAETPKITPPNDRTYASGTLVYLESLTRGAEIYYTTDGSEPTLGSTQYTAGIPINRSTTIKAIAVLSGYRTSEVAEASYTVQLTDSNKAVVSVGFAESGEDKPFTIPVSIETAESTNVRSFKIVLHYGSDVRYTERCQPLKGISPQEMTVGHDEVNHIITIRLDSNNRRGYTCGDFANLSFHVPASAFSGRVPITIDEELTSVTGTASTTSGVQELNLTFENGYVDLDTNNSRIAFQDMSENTINSASEVRSGAKILVDPDPIPITQMQAQTVSEQVLVETATVFCAVYDRQHVMVHLQAWDVDLSDPRNIAMSGSIQIPENVSVGEIRVFVLSEDLVPLQAAGILS